MKNATFSFLIVGSIIINISVYINIVCKQDVSLRVLFNHCVFSNCANISFI